MATAPCYSTLFHCLYDEDCQISRRFPCYSVFRAIDSRDVVQKPTQRPHVHDFAVIWDDDHDTRIIPVLEEMLMAGVLPGVQFIGEHKGRLSIILAARTYYAIDIDAYKEKVIELARASGDCWTVEVGMIDHHEGNMRELHQCDFLEIVGNEDADIAFIFMIDAAWQLGTKAWRSIDLPPPPPAPGKLFFPKPNRYLIDPPRNRTESSFPLPPMPPVPPTR